MLFLGAHKFLVLCLVSRGKKDFFFPTNNFSRKKKHIILHSYLFPSMHLPIIFLINIYHSCLYIKINWHLLSIVREKMKHTKYASTYISIFLAIRALILIKPFILIQVKAYILLLNINLLNSEYLEFQI